MRTFRQYFNRVKNKLYEANDPKTYWSKPDQVEWFSKYAVNHVFKTPQEARDWVYRRLQHWDTESWNRDNPTGPDGNQAIAVQTPIFKTKEGYKIGVRPKVSRARVDRLGSSEPEGSAPRVDWSASDLEDNVRHVTADSIRRNYVPVADQDKVTVYPAYVPNGDVPDEQLVEELPNEDDDDDPGSYAWDDMSPRATFPPIKLMVDRRGKVTILDGNHRTRYWREHGFDSFPAWVIDYRPLKRER